MKILVTGGTVFVSKSVAEHFIKRGDEVYVLNRNTRPQLIGARLIEADRLDLGDKLKNLYFDAVIDVAVYTAEDVKSLLNAIGGFEKYVMISSSAVYDGTKMPLKEDAPCGANKFWGLYGANKTEAEKVLFGRVPGAYVLRPAYIYGEYNNLYREAFVFDCAAGGLPFYLPEKCNLRLQFSYIGDLCRLIEKIILKTPDFHIVNVGDDRRVTAEEWVKMCYSTVGATPQFRYVSDEFKLHKYFPFMNYDYEVDVTLQNSLLDGLTPLGEGLRRSYAWYKNNGGEVRKKDYAGFIKENIDKS